MLSLSSSSQLLVAESCRLHIYNTAGKLVKSLDVPNDEYIRDAVWTPRGNIVVTTNESVTVVSVLGGVIVSNKLKRDGKLSVSTDDVIYLFDEKDGVFQSVDDGVTWSHVFKLPDINWRLYNVIKLSTQCNIDDFFAVERDSSYTEFRLRMYTVDRKQVENSLTWRDINLPKHVNCNCCELAFDGHSNIFMTDYNNGAVHVWSVNGHYDHQLLSVHDFSDSDTKVSVDVCNNKPKGVAVSKQKGHKMYVLQRYDKVDELKLAYEPVMRSLPVI